VLRPGNPGNYAQNGAQIDGQLLGLVRLHCSAVAWMNGLVDDQ